MILDRLDTLIAFVVILAGISLLVTVMTQAVSALLALRGANLRWAIETLLKELDPNLKTYAATIAEEVLRHPLISDSTFSRFGLKLLDRWKLASAIRRDELIEVLHLLVQSFQEAKGVSPDPWRAALRRSLGQDDQTLSPQPLSGVRTEKSQQGEQATTEAKTPALLQLPARIERWFDSMMDRASQRFVTQTRLCTIIFSVLVAFALHLDAQKLLRQLSSDAEMRSRLVASADALARKADEIVVPPAEGASGIYLEAMRRLIDTHKNELAALGEPSGFTDLAGAKKWLSTRLRAAGIEQEERWQQEYDLLVPQAALLKAADNLQAIWREHLGFGLIPDPYPTPWYNYWTPSWSHFFGVLASAVLLSLGAPFWFNMLKSLSNLRPVIANRDQQERKAPDTT